jgi:hypothetical protein
MVEASNPTATVLASAGVDIRTIAGRLGHAHPAITLPAVAGTSERHPEGYDSRLATSSPWAGQGARANGAQYWLFRPAMSKGRAGEHWAQSEVQKDFEERKRALGLGGVVLASRPARACVLSPLQRRGSPIAGLPEAQDRYEVPSRAARRSARRWSSTSG